MIISLLLILSIYNPIYFTLTAYCPYACCNEKWAGFVSNGKTFKYYRDKNINVCAVDPKVIPLNSIIEWQGNRYLAVDVGGKIKGNRIDILLDTHKETIIFGVKKNQTVKIIQRVKTL